MTHIEKVTKLRDEMIQAVLNHFDENKLGLIRFNHMFSVLLPVENMFGDIEQVGTFIARRMANDGTIFGMDLGLSEEADWDVNELDVVEIAHILDTLEANKYDRLPDNYDPDEDPFDYDHNL